MTTISTPGATTSTGKSADRLYNFSAGPAILPEPVLKQAQKDLWNISESGIGILEHSHRGKVFDRVIEEAEHDIRELAKIPENYRVLFLQGGASSQFFMLPMNFTGADQEADYFNTGKWSVGAIKEAEALCRVNVVASSEETAFDRIPDRATWGFATDAVFCHFTSNNTIAGTQWRAPPEHPSDAWLACDASSDLFSGLIDVSKYGLIYAGAQKNLGPSGTVLVIVRDDLVDGGREDLPTMLKYKTHAEKGSRYNTPPTFGIYIIRQVAKWILGEGGLAAMEERNGAKATLLYDFLDGSAMFKGHAQHDSRSLMNVTFRTSSPDLDSACIQQATKKGLPGLKGHRSVGGLRASMYNAFPVEGTAALVEFLKEFERTNG